MRQQLNHWQAFQIDKVLASAEISFLDLVKDCIKKDQLFMAKYYSVELVRACRARRMFYELPEEEL
jgi:hypothetical protein